MSAASSDWIPHGTIRLAERAYDRIDDIVMPNLYYRDDIGERWIDGDGDRLQAWGYLGP